MIPASVGWGQDAGSVNPRSQGVLDASHAHSKVWRLPVLLWATPNPWVTGDPQALPAGLPEPLSSQICHF